MEVPAFGNLFHGVILGLFPVEDLPDPSEASEAYLVVKLVEGQLVLFLFYRMFRLAIPHAKLDGAVIFGACY